MIGLSRRECLQFTDELFALTAGHRLQPRREHFQLSQGRIRIQDRFVGRLEKDCGVGHYPSQCRSHRGTTLTVMLVMPNLANMAFARVTAASGAVLATDGAPRLPGMPLRSHTVCALPRQALRPRLTLVRGRLKIPRTARQDRKPKIGHPPGTDRSHPRPSRRQTPRPPAPRWRTARSPTRSRRMPALSGPAAGLWLSSPRQTQRGSFCIRRMHSHGNATTTGSASWSIRMTPRKRAGRSG